MSADLDLLQTYARTRDAQAFSALVSNYSDMVYGTCLRILKNVADAEDATQECFLRLARDSAKVHTSLGAWLHRCATNECISRVRSVSANSRRERAYEVNRHEDKKISAWGEVSDQVDRALEELPEELRHVLVGHFLERKTQTELAAELGVSPATMSRRINEGVEAIRKKLTRAGVIVTAVALGVMLLEHTAQAAPARLMASLGKMALAGPGAAVSASAAGVGNGVGGGTAASGGSAAATTSSGTLLSGKMLLAFTGAALFVTVAASVLLWNLTRPALPGAAGVQASGRDLKSSALESAARDEAIAALTPEDRQIYEMIYQLRMATPPDKPAEWVSVVRNIAQAGKPAVPALVAELDGTRRDGEQRLIMLALRMIGDPRAVPALIRAIPRVSAASIGLDFLATDSDTKTFLADHAIARSSGERYGLSSLDAGITQCNAALETITRHSEGHDAIINGARNDQPAEVARDEQLREEFADRWQQWWKAHQHEFVSDQDLETLKTARLDVIDPIGLEKFGRIFPTGTNIHIGPIREATLQAAGTWDAKAYIDFDAGRLYERNEGWRNITPERAADWIADAGVDAYVRLTHPTDRAATSRICMLQGRGLTAWRIANERFDTLEKEVQSDKPLDMGSWGATDSLIALDVETGAPKYSEYPVTFLFTTREGGRGVMQVLGMTGEGAAMRVRYRMFEGMPVQAAPLAAATPAPDRVEIANFGMQHEVSLGLPAAKDDSALALHSGKTQPQNAAGIASADVMFTLAKRQWLQTWGGDLLTLTWPNRQLCGLGGEHMIAMEVSPAAWDALSPADAETLLTRREPSASDVAGTFMIPDPAHDMPATWIIQTRAGEVGMLQITELSNDHLTLRYKLIGAE